MRKEWNISRGSPNLTRQIYKDKLGSTQKFKIWCPQIYTHEYTRIYDSVFKY